MKLARVWVASVMVLACCAVTAHGATKTATGELESRLLEEVRNSTSSAWMGPAVNAQDRDDGVRDFWEQFRDPALIAATERWVQGRQFDNSNTLIAQWTREFGRIAVGGINYWTDDEIDTYLRGSMHQGWIFNRELCLNPTLGLRSAVDIEPGDLIAFLQTIKRTHLAAQAHQVPRPALTASDTEDAYMAGLEVMPQANRNQFVDLVKGGRQRLSASQRCEAVEILLRGVLSVPAEAGQQMRRAYFLAAAPRMFAPPKEMRPQKEAQVPTVNGRILAVTVPAEWEE
ncbi:MAG: hypothetical protein H7255_08510, partial [Ramlibacter sp.]|nr:hypothetical protein [Ramlibacter sp.]